MSDLHDAAEYNASQITVLEGLDAVRKRPGMYIGSTGPRGLHHLVYEVVDNAVDEALAGFCDHIDVTILPDNAIRVIDNGRGIPVDIQAQTGKPALEVVFTVLHAGGKFGGGGYAVSGGLHGVGSSVVNALSSHLDAVVHRDGFEWTQSYNDGVPAGPVQQGQPADDSGTTVTFWPSEQIFESTVYDFETLRQRFQQMAFLNKGLRITLTDLRGEEPHVVSYRYEQGLTDYVAYLNSAKKVEVIHPDIIDIESEDADQTISVEVAMQWGSSYSESVHTYANTINTHEGGTHEEGFRTALTSIINKYARAQNILKDRDDNLLGEDVREGLTAVVSVKLAEPQFEGQTKTKLGNTEAKAFVQRVVSERLADWFDRNPQQAKDIVRKGIGAAAARTAARKAREATRRKSYLESSGMPGKLKDCSSKNAEICEIFLVEGDSAGGSAVQGRNPATQAILPLRGKILNVEKARIDRAMQNNEIQAMITAFGAGISGEFNIEKLRYHKIVIMSDADVDGQHIQTLLLTFFFRYMRPLIENGFVFLAMPPLYRLKWVDGDHEFAYSDAERDALVELGRNSGRRLPKDNGIQRYKGLGEMNYSELWETTMDPETRTLRQVTLEDALLADETFTILMGEDVEARREFIQDNAKDVRFLDI